MQGGALALSSGGGPTWFYWANNVSDKHPSRLPLFPPTLTLPPYPPTTLQFSPFASSLRLACIREPRRVLRPRTTSSLTPLPPVPQLATDSPPSVNRIYRGTRSDSLYRWAPTPRERPSPQTCLALLRIQ